MLYNSVTGEILGVHIIGLHAADLIHEASNAIATKQTVQARRRRRFALCARRRPGAKRRPLRRCLLLSLEPPTLSLPPACFNPSNPRSPQTLNTFIQPLPSPNHPPHPPQTPQNPTPPPKTQKPKTKQDIKFNVHAHPTLSEVLDELFKQAHVTGPVKAGAKVPVGAAH